MRVLQITSSTFIGGGERHVADLSRALFDRGHDVFVAIAPGAKLRGELDFLPNARIAEFPLRNAMDVATATKIARFVRENEIDLIHAHVGRDYPIAAIASRISRAPFVITRHVLFPMTRLHKLLLRNVRAVIAPSNAVAKSLRYQRIFPDEKIVTVQHGLDTSKYQIHRRSNGESFVVGSVGNLDPVKGFDILIHAAAIAVKRIPQLRFEIVGTDRAKDLHNERELLDLISKLHLEKHIELRGATNDIAGELNRFDLYVSASRSESFGYAIAEAMLGGVPVIASETEGAKEIISNPSVGRLVPAESPVALAEAIIELFDDPGARADLARDARLHVENNFSIARMANETEATYRRAVGSE